MIGENMALSNDDILELARQAVKNMFDQNGPEFTFPFDYIWKFLPDDVSIPGSSKPHQARKLIGEGYIQRTGNLTRASSEARASSVTPEYRFGSVFIPKNTAPDTNVAGDYSFLISELQKVMERDGYIISPAELANFYLAMMTSPLVILSGISGTGKSLLPRLFTKYTSANFYPISVQPQWSDNSDMFGYVPTLSMETFVQGRIMPSLYEALNNKNNLNIVLLDEMNLAPVEHYFSDFLSVAESRRRENGVIVTDRLPLDLPMPNSAEDKYKNIRNMVLPSNIRIVGTANMDETTNSFSPKVLDRAFTIEFDDPDLTAFPTEISLSNNVDLTQLATLLIRESNPISIHEARLNSQNLFEHVSVLLKEVQEILAPAGIKFGYRTRDAILLYLHFWKELNLSEILPASAALDFCLLQKILPKINGTGEILIDALQEFSEWLNSKKDDSETTFNFTGPFNRSYEKILRMKSLLESDGATHFWGV